MSGAKRTTAIDAPGDVEPALEQLRRGREAKALDAEKSHPRKVVELDDEAITSSTPA